MKLRKLRVAGIMTLAVGLGGSGTGGMAQDSVTKQEANFQIMYAGKPISVGWNVQESQCMLAIHFNLPRVNGVAPAIPKNRVWLLSRDGTVISPSGKPMWVGLTTGLGPPSNKLWYSFPLSAQSNAVAVVVNVMTNFVVQPLEELQPR